MCEYILSDNEGHCLTICNKNRITESDFCEEHCKCIVCDVVLSGLRLYKPRICQVHKTMCTL